MACCFLASWAKEVAELSSSLNAAQKGYQLLESSGTHAVHKKSVIPKREYVAQAQAP